MLLPVGLRSGPTLPTRRRPAQALAPPSRKATLPRIKGNAPPCGVVVGAGRRDDFPILSFFLGGKKRKVAGMIGAAAAELFFTGRVSLQVACFRGLTCPPALLRWCWCRP